MKMNTKSLVSTRKNDTASKLQVVGAGGLVVWAGVAFIPFFPLLMLALLVAGVVMKVRS
jgi:hypothetical protein